jgi:integrase
MIKRVPLKRDPPGQCGRWRVIVYNKETKKFDWHTVRGTRADAKALERKFEDAKRKGEYTGPLERRTFEEMANLFLDDRRANNRRMSTLEEYQTELKIRLFPRPNEKLPQLGPRDIRNIKRADMKAHFNALRNSGCTVSQVNKSIKAAKAIFTYAFDLEYGTSNIMQRYRRLQRVDGEPKTNRGVFTEAELQAIFASATPFELGLFATLSNSGPRPGEIYALDWSAVYLEVEKPYFRIERTWCSKGFRFYGPKTEAGPAHGPDLGMARVHPSRAPRPLGRGGARLSEYGRHRAQQGERAQAGVDAAVGACPGSLSRYVFAALDLRQLGARKRGGGLQRLPRHRACAQHDRRYDLCPHGRFGAGRSQRECGRAHRVDAAHAARGPRPADRAASASEAARHRGRTTR